MVEEKYIQPGQDHVCVDTLVEILKTLQANQEKRQLIEKKRELRERADLRVRYPSSSKSFLLNQIWVAYQKGIIK